MPTLPVENAVLFYEVYPSTPTPKAPTLLLIHGGNGTLNGFRQLANLLATSLNVIIYDRRGFSRSALTGPQDYTGTARIERDAADAAALIAQISPSGKAVVLGNSSGALVALEVLVQHPENVEVLFAHEPPAMAHLKGKEEWYAKQKAVYDLYREKGHVAAMGVFAELVKAKDDSGWATGAAARMKEEQLAPDPYFAGNITYWFEREVMQTVFHKFDLGRLRSGKEKLVLVNGKGTSPEAPQYLGNVELAKEVGLEITMFEGGHLAWQVDPQQFAEDIKTILRGRGGLYSEL